MYAGELNERVTIIRRLPPMQDGYGQPKEQWLPERQPRWAKVTPKLSRENPVNGGPKIETTYDIIIRWTPAFESSGCRVQWRGRMLDVASVIDPDGRRVRLLLACVEHP